MKATKAQPNLLDLGCCQGGATRGYQLAGFRVTGVDRDQQPRYCGDEFIQADALEYLAEHGHEYDAIHSSMPCQGYSDTQRLHGKAWPRLIAPTRLILLGMGHPCWVMENVAAAPLLDPVELCGAMFGLRTYRHRLFESNLPLAAPAHPAHKAPQAKMGRPAKPGEFVHLVGNFSGVTEAKAAVGIDWMNRDGLRESVPPAYTEFVGRQLLDHLSERAA
jgi:DNA (cytosine-5)-methyltransferase 1